MAKERPALANSTKFYLLAYYLLGLLMTFDDGAVSQV